MKRIVLVLLTLITLAVIGCNNFFHELLPSDDDRIKSFSVPGQMSVEIGDNAIYATVSPNTELSALIPAIRVDSGATVFPVTYEYTSRAFGDERTFGAAMELYTGGNNTERVMELIRDNKDSFTVPALDMPIDFSYPVDFVILSARGTIRRYTVTVEIDTGEGKFRSFRFEKFFNPEIVLPSSSFFGTWEVTATVGVIDTSTKTVMVNVSYPVENIASYQLTPTFETNGARVYLDGTEWRSGESLVGFLKPPDSLDLNNPLYGSQTKTLTLKRSGFPDAEWTLIVKFSEDPDTSRAIIDFRFNKALNPLINADYMAGGIYASDSFGYINITIYYSGAKPETLRASFISPGTVTVNDEIQISGYSTQDFSSSVRYVVTSKVGNNVRTYSVYVEILPLSDPTPQITYFSFRTEQNPLLVSSSTALINHDSRLILIEAAYDGDTPPVNLIPDFVATGTVTVNGVTQRSTSSSVNFSSLVGYTVSNPSNPTFKREYRVEVKFVRALSSAAEITTFTFYQADNPDLIADIKATVNQRTGTITATLLFDKNLPGGNRTLIPRWSAQGRVESNGVAQTSGELKRQFYTSMQLRAISADGVFKKDYTVTIKEINTRIYVKHDATGRNDGTNWENAYKSVSNVGNDTNSFSFFYNDGAYYDYTSIPREVWIAEGTYTVQFTRGIDCNTPNVYLIGGFRGNEASLSARVDPINHRAIITGDQGGGKWIGGPLIETVQGYVENLIIACASDYPYGRGGGIWAWGNLTLKNVDFRDIETYYSGGAVAVWGSSDEYEASVVTITDCSFTNTRTDEIAGAIYISDSRNVTINNCTFTNIYAASINHDSNDDAWRGGGALGFQLCNRVTVTNCTFVNTRVANNRGNAICYYRSNVTQSGNTFTNVSSPQVYSY
jgi:hypothetical protein